VKHKITPREVVQIIAALRFWGRAAETSGSHPKDHPLVAGRFHRWVQRTQTYADTLPMTNDEIETLIGRLDGTWDRGLRTWDAGKYL
jgi:hypothetical protein